MTPLWAALAVYLCGYGITAAMVADRLHYREQTDPEVAAARDEHPTFALACLIAGTIARATIWPVYARHAWWWRRAAGLDR
ncbi:hypothetical protein [Nocardia nova]|uniref:hypothetical protein n=1 Tax=Nocardia nova TaxID=37330 RepID=UPI0018954E28|nr:hypothetical protein [Nocardia nova]MBF6277048.1 hypothetical protein [Nocardia nova]